LSNGSEAKKRQRAEWRLDAFTGLSIPASAYSRFKETTQLTRRL
jgi:hypothetical protein